MVRVSLVREQILVTVFFVGDRGGKSPWEVGKEPGGGGGGQRERLLLRKP